MPGLRLSVFAARALSVAALLGACGPTGPSTVTPDLVARARKHDAAANEALLSAGRELFVTRCHDCHELPDPTAHAAASWPALVARMGKLARLDSVQERDLLRYLTAASE